MQMLFRILFMHKNPLEEELIAVSNETGMKAMILQKFKESIVHFDLGILHWS